MTATTGMLRKKRKQATAMRVVGVILLIWFGLAAISNMGAAWGWQLGEPVQVHVANVCRGFVSDGFLTDCTGEWTTADGQSHSGAIDGFNREHLGETVAARAYGDKAYYHPQLMTQLVGLPAPFAGGLGVLLIVLSFFVAPSRRRMKAERARVQAEPLPAEAEEAARAAGLGAQDASYWTNDGLERVLTVFEHGFVYGSPTAGPQAYRWDNVVAVWEKIIRSNVSIEYEYRMRFPNADDIVLSGRTVDGLDTLGKVLVQASGNRVLPRAVAAVQGGSPYAFPATKNGTETVLSGQGVSGPDGTITWADLANVSVSNGQITIAGRQGKLRRQWIDTGNAAVLVTVLRAVLEQRAGQAPRQ